MHRELYKYALSAPRPPFSKKRAAFEKIPYHFFSKVGRTEKKAAR
jgi:hypothetical protein